MRHLQELYGKGGQQEEGEDSSNKNDDFRYHTDNQPKYDLTLFGVSLHDIPMSVKYGIGFFLMVLIMSVLFKLVNMITKKSPHDNKRRDKKKKQN
jgi:hypothetical protein